VFVLPSGACCKNQRHTPCQAIASELERKKVRKLGITPITAMREHIMAEQKVYKGPEVAFWRACATRP